MHCLQENRVILKLGSDKKSIYATRCCFKPEVVIGGLTFEQIEELSKQVIYQEGDLKIYWSLANWSKDIFYKVPKYDMSVSEKCKTSAVRCRLSEMTFRNISVNFSHACNLRCKHCYYDKYDSQEIQKLYFNTLKSLKNIYCDISFTEEGEPFINKEKMLEVLNMYHGGLHKAVHFISNMTLLDSEYIEKLHELAKKSGVYYSFVASCDGITKETYKEIRRIDAFDKVIENIKHIAEIGALDNSMNIDGINFIVQPDNLKEIFEVKPFFNTIFEGLGDKVNIIPFCKSSLKPESADIEKEILNSAEWKEYCRQNKKV